MPIPQLDKKPQMSAKKAGKSVTKSPIKAGKKPGQSGPKRTRGGKRRKKGFFKNLTWKKAGLGVLVFGLFGLLGIGIVFAVIAQELPDPNKINDRAVAQSTRIYARDGETLLYEIHGDENRTLIKFEDIPEYAVKATLAAEDDEFYEHHGFDWKGFMRAVYANVFSGDLRGQGGSTLTQQFVKNAIVGTEKTYTRKLKELVLSLEIEQIYSKDEILQLYFNEIPYGSTAYGIESASRYYFDKSVGDLSIAEGAVLAALPQSPTYYSPYGSHVEDLMVRKDWVLDRMAELDYITEEEAEAAKEEELVFAERREDINAPHFVFYVKQQLVDKYGEKVVEQGGLKVTTTLDWDKQKLAEQAVNDGMDKIRSMGGENAALVSIDAHNGQILAMVGSYDYFADDIDGQVNVTIRPRQPGSSLKPLAYMTAYEEGYTPNTVLWDVETDFPIDGGTYHPRNYDLGQRGPISMKQALSTSLNIPAVKTLYLVGIDKFIDNAEAAGYSTFADRSRFGLAIVLGGGEVTLLDHTSTNATYAREGERHAPAGILKIEDSTGEVLHEWEDKKEQVLDQKAVRMLNYSLADGWVKLNGRSVAAKTGTTNDYRDAWTMGYTPSVATGVWVGNNDNSEMARGAAGLVVASPIFKQYMNAVLDGTPAETFNDPEIPSRNNAALNGSITKGEKKWVDTETGKIIPEECLEDYPEEFKEEKEFKIAHSILYYVNREDPLGGAPSNPQSDPMFKNWEAAVRNWAEGKTDEGYIANEDDLEYQDCGFRDPSNVPTIKINAPTGTLDRNTWDIDVEITPGENREIAMVEYMIDETVVDTKTSAPWDSTYIPYNLTLGNHVFKVRVTDNGGVKGELQTNFKYRTQNEGFFTIISPSNGEEVTSPITVRAHVPNHESAKKVSFYAKENPAIEGQLPIGEVTNPSSSTAEIIWYGVPGTGDFTLFAKVFNDDGTVDRSSEITVTVK